MIGLVQDTNFKALFVKLVSTTPNIPSHICILNQSKSACKNIHRKSRVRILRSKQTPLTVTVTNITVIKYEKKTILRTSNTSNNSIHPTNDARNKYNNKQYHNNNKTSRTKIQGEITKLQNKVL